MNVHVRAGIYENPDAWETGVLKWFDPTRRFGFVIPANVGFFSGREIFLHWLKLQKCSIAEAHMREGVRVSFRWGPDPRGRPNPVVTEIRLID
jgi:cold shock CspA family protein